MAGFSIEKMKQADLPGTETVVINGEMTILNAVEIRGVLLDALQNGSDLHLDIKGVSEVDLTGLQMICAGHIASIKLGKGFIVNFSSNEPLIKIIHDAGFLRHIGCSIDISKSCVWTGGENR